jgi:hypothetical protein
MVRSSSSTVCIKKLTSYGGDMPWCSERGMVDRISKSNVESRRRESRGKMKRSTTRYLGPRAGDLGYKLALKERRVWNPSKEICV